jgi:16S rRNA (adenine(1408)-N(1))-methyltransferase
METIWGRTLCYLNLTELSARLVNHQRVILDLGTGDGKFAFHHARTFPSQFVIGVDSCRENLHEFSRTKQSNLLFLIASAQDLPHELNGLVSHITINFPWGSLLESLLTGDSSLLCGLAFISQGHTSIDIRLNGGALAKAGMTLENGTMTIHNNLLQAGWRIKTPISLDTCALRKFPSTWAKRLAFGRDPRAIQLSGCL